MTKDTLIEELRSILLKRFGKEAPTILCDCCDDVAQYDAARQIFNTKFQFRPRAIVYVTDVDQVSLIVKFANQHPLLITLRARSGGHDHEGECSGTDTIVIDFARMNQILARPELGKNVISVGPGARFKQVKAALDEMHLGIAHGTCETVCVAGYTMGGGWGPWTRKYGMGCERLIGATIVLGDGTIKHLDHTAEEDSAEAELLWALRGGGGFSYGIVTDLIYDAFELPRETTHSFNVHFVGKDGLPDQAAIDILRKWEQAIAYDKNPNLIGTNLKIDAMHLEQGQEPDPLAKLDCTFNGYFVGDRAEIEDLVAQYFGPQYVKDINISLQPQVSKSGKGLLAPTSKWHFDSWDRKPSRQFGLVRRLLAKKGGKKGKKALSEIALETEGPAPHKITSRLVNAQGWDDSGRKALICSLQSEWVAPLKYSSEGLESSYGIHQYITLGAICGPYYAKQRHYDALGISFPYSDRPFTIQYQAWWDQFFDNGNRPSMADIQRYTLENRQWVNRAQDWIEACRQYDIPHTSGAFISFKDSAVMTKTYFAQSYDALRDVKMAHSEDELMLFKTRKTII